MAFEETFDVKSFLFYRIITKNDGECEVNERNAHIYINV